MRSCKGEVSLVGSAFFGFWWISVVDCVLGLFVQKARFDLVMLCTTSFWIMQLQQSENLYWVVKVSSIGSLTTLWFNSSASVTRCCIVNEI